MDLELISFKLCPFVQRSVITLKKNNAPYTIRYVDLADPPAWFLRLSPSEKVPLLVIDGAQVLFESSVINEFIDDVTPGRLHSEDPLRRARSKLDRKLRRSEVTIPLSALMAMMPQVELTARGR